MQPTKREERWPSARSSSNMVSVLLLTYNDVLKSHYVVVLFYHYQLQLFFERDTPNQSQLWNEGRGLQGENWDKALLFVLWQKMLHLLW